MSKKVNANNVNRLITKKKVTISLFIVVLFLGVCAFLFTNGYTNYYFAYAKCGMKQPVAVYHWSPYNKQYTLPGDESYPSHSSFFVEYVCKPQEAINLGAKYAPQKSDLDASYSDKE